MIFPVIFRIGPLTVSPLTFLVPVAFLLVSFFLWFSLKEDYPEEEIIGLTIYLTFVFLVGARLAYILSHFGDFRLSLLKWLMVSGHSGFNFVGGFLACLAFLIWWSKKRRWDFWQVIEWVVPAWFLAAFLIGPGLYLISGKIVFLGEALLALLLLIFGLFLRKKYRSFIWYRSGKLGFVSSVSTAGFMIGKLMLDIFDRGGIYWEGLFLVIMALSCVTVVYYRSGRVLREDLARITQQRKNEKTSR